MRRLFIALAALSLILPASAQMRGGHAGGHAFGGRGFGGGRAFGPVVPRVNSPRSGPIIRTVAPFGRFGRGRFGRHHDFNNGFNFPFVFSCQRNPAFCDANGIPFNTTFLNGVPFGGGFAGNGFFGGFGYGSYVIPPDYYDQPSTAYAEHTMRYHEDPRDGVITDLMFQLRDQQRELDYLMNSRRQRMPEGAQQQQAPMQQGPGTRGNLLRQQSQPAASNTPQQPATTLVFKDGHRADIYNYAIAKGTLTVLDNGLRNRIPLSQLDIPATQKANEDRGVTFKVPMASVSLMCNPADPDFECHQHQAQTGQGGMMRP
jgi:hypothetical protein